jgi:hypothetical protein
MPAQRRCQACDRYELQQENFCRICGFEFQPDADAPFPATGKAYLTSEKFCGHCGCTRGNCHCAERIGVLQQASDDG